MDEPDVPVMLSFGEHVLTAQDVAAMGGKPAVYEFRSVLRRWERGESE